MNASDFAVQVPANESLLLMAPLGLFLLWLGTDILLLLWDMAAPALLKLTDFARGSRRINLCYHLSSRGPSDSIHNLSLSRSRMLYFGKVKLGLQWLLPLGALVKLLIMRRPMTPPDFAANASNVFTGYSVKRRFLSYRIRLVYYPDRSNIEDEDDEALQEFRQELMPDVSESVPGDDKHSMTLVVD